MRSISLQQNEKLDTWTQEGEHPIGHHAREPEIFRRSVNACILSREWCAVTVCCAASKSASG
jgi:hypothetical protein